MSILRLAELTWREVKNLDRNRLVAILPIGAVEAHGPHLPISTDTIISTAMAEEGARLLLKRDLQPLLLPPVEYTSASFAAGFPGTLSLRPETVTGVLVDIGLGLGKHDIQTLVIANSHFDPTHLQSIYDALGRLSNETELQVIFPDVTRKPWALRLTEEFKSGACHAGCYEGSIVLARRPDLVRKEIGRNLPENPVSLSRAIWKGLKSFEAAGGPDAYFGNPAAATMEEGENTIAELGAILDEAVGLVFEKP